MLVKRGTRGRVKKQVVVDLKLMPPTTRLHIFATSMPSKPLCGPWLPKGTIIIDQLSDNLPNDALRSKLAVVATGYKESRSKPPASSLFFPPLEIDADFEMYIHSLIGLKAIMPVGRRRCRPARHSSQRKNIA